MEWAEAECEYPSSMNPFRSVSSLLCRPPQGPSAAMGAYGNYDQNMMQGARGPGAFGPQRGRGARRW